MATKPTDRILDWASGGTTTDPGGAKEAAGWVIDDQPPANWWNWILNSFGQWLSWSEDSIDDIETKTDFITVTQAVDLDTIESDTNTNTSSITTLNAAIPRVVCRVETGATPVVQWDGVIGLDVSTVTYSGSLCDITFVSDIVNTVTESVTLITGATLGEMYTGNVIATDKVRISCVDDAGTTINLSTAVRVLQVAVWGVAP